MIVSTYAGIRKFEQVHLVSLRRFLTATATSESHFTLSKIAYYKLQLFGSTKNVTLHTQLRQNCATRVYLRILGKFTMSSCKNYNNNFHVMFARTRRKQFSIAIKVVSLWYSLHNFAMVLHHGIHCTILYNCPHH